MLKPLGNICVFVGKECVRLGLLAGVVKQVGHFLRNGRHDGAVKHGVQTGKQKRADNNRNQDLHAGIDVTLGDGAVQHGMGGSSDLSLLHGQRVLHVLDLSLHELFDSLKHSVHLLSHSLAPLSRKVSYAPLTASWICLRAEEEMGWATSRLFS